jgi:P4 family phage/plasmid primase-like protien
MTEPTQWDRSEPTDDELRALNDDVLVTPSDDTIIGSTYSRTDWGNAQRLALYEGQNQRYVNDHDEWYTWGDTRWCKATTGDRFGAAARIALKIADETAHIDNDDARDRHVQWSQQSLSETHLRSLMNVATGLDELRVSSSDYDARGDLLNFPNCTLNPLTFEWHTHQREDMLTQICPTAYDPNATSPLLDAFLERFLPDAKERDYTLQVLATAALSHGNATRKLFLLLGPTSTGKSTLMELMQKTLGRDYVAAGNPSIFRGNLEDKPRPDLLRTIGTRLVLAFEASDRWELHTDQIKRMTGGDTITARGMRSNVMDETTATFVPIIVANTEPHIVGSDDALRRRLAALVMDTPIAEEDDDGSKRAELVSSDDARRALLARLIRIYHDCNGAVTLPVPIRFVERTMELFAALDDVDEVMRQLKDEGSIYQGSIAVSHCIPTMMLFKCYRTWIDTNGTRQMKNERLGPKGFSQRLKSLGYEVVRSNGMRVAGWCMGDTHLTNIARYS